MSHASPEVLGSLSLNLVKRRLRTPMQVADYSSKINGEVDPAKIAASLHFSIDSVMGWLDAKLFKVVEA